MSHHVFSPEQRREITTKLNDAVVEIEGETMRQVTWCVVRDVASGDWGIAGNPLTIADGHALAAGVPTPFDSMTAVRTTSPSGRETGS